MSMKSRNGCNKEVPCLEYKVSQDFVSQFNSILSLLGIFFLLLSIFGCFKHSTKLVWKSNLDLFEIQNICALFAIIPSVPSKMATLVCVKVSQFTTLNHPRGMSVLLLTTFADCTGWARVAHVKENLSLLTY